MRSGRVTATGGRREGRPITNTCTDAAVEFEALTDAEFVLGYYSVHTSPQALRDGETQIVAIRKRLVQEGRI
jgi:hypothetical protein